MNASLGQVHSLHAEARSWVEGERARLKTADGEEGKSASLLRVVSRRPLHLGEDAHYVAAQGDVVRDRRLAFLILNGNQLVVAVRHDGEHLPVSRYQCGQQVVRGEPNALAPQVARQAFLWVGLEVKVMVEAVHVVRRLPKGNPNLDQQVRVKWDPCLVER